MRPVLASLLLLAACSSGEQADPAPQPSASPLPSAPPGLVLAVAHDAVVDLVRVDADRVATVELTLQAPREGLVAREAALTAGARPEACVLWDLGESLEPGGGELRCYLPGDGTGTRVEEADHPQGNLALSADGTRIAWEAGEGTSYVTTARRSGTTVSEVVDLPEDDEGYVTELAWLDDDHLMLQRTTGDNDDPGQPFVLDLGSGVERQVTEQELVLTDRFDDASALGRDGHRAVRFDLAAGRVLEVVATAADDRVLDGVSGGPAGVVYVTRGREDVRVYLRLPGESRGVAVEGLPVELEFVSAQPS